MSRDLDLNNNFLRRNKLFLFGISICLALILCEFFLVLVGYSKKPHSWIFSNEEFIQDTEYRNFFTVDRKEIFKPRKNTTIALGLWETDEYGFRFNPNHYVQPADRSFIVLGDSQAYGHGVWHEESWPFLLEKGLNDLMENIWVHNAGVPASSTDQQYVRFQKLVKQFNPEKIIWMISQNDMTETNLACLYRENHDGEFRSFSARSNIAYVNAWLTKLFPKWFSHTHVGNVLTTLSVNGHDLYTIGCSQDAADTDLEKIYFSKLQYIIEHAKQIAENNGGEVIFVFSPPQTYFDPMHSNESHDIVFFKKFTDFLSQANVPYIDLSFEFAKRLDPALLSYRMGMITQEELFVTERPALNTTLYLDETDLGTPYGGWHLNQQGNELVAEVIIEYIR